MIDFGISQNPADQPEGFPTPFRCEVCDTLPPGYHVEIITCSDCHAKLESGTIKLPHSPK